MKTFAAMLGALLLAACAPTSQRPPPTAYKDSCDYDFVVGSYQYQHCKAVKARPVDRS